MVKWINQETEKLVRAGWAIGSPRETEMLETWKRVRPRMMKRLGKWAPKLAFVLDDRRFKSVNQYIRAGWPPTDAEEEATREWCLLEPEDGTSP